MFTAIIVGILACGLFVGTIIAKREDDGLDPATALGHAIGWAFLGGIVAAIADTYVFPTECPGGWSLGGLCGTGWKAHPQTGMFFGGYIVGCIVGFVLSLVPWRAIGDGLDERATIKAAEQRAKTAEQQAEQQFQVAKAQAYQTDTLQALLALSRQYQDRIAKQSDFKQHLHAARDREEDADIASARQANTVAGYEQVLEKWRLMGRRQDEVTRYRDDAAAEAAVAAKARADRERAEAEASEAAHQLTLARNALRNALLTMIENAEWLASDDKTSVVIPARNAIRGELNKIERNPLITLAMLREPDTTVKLNELVTLLRANEGPDSLLLGSVITALKIEQGVRGVAVGKQSV